MAETRPWVLASPDYQAYARLVSFYIQQKQILDALYDKDRVRQNRLEHLLQVAALQNNVPNMTRWQNEIDAIEANRQAAVQRAETDLEDLVQRLAASDYQRTRFPKNYGKFLQYY